MKILVTGATGFVGQHLVSELLKRGHDIVAIARDESRARKFNWYRSVKFIVYDINEDNQDAPDKIGSGDCLVHLAWPGLPNYNGLFHLENNLPSSYDFIKTMVEAGIAQVTVTGTCLEYGLQYGPLSSEAVTDPTTSYGIAKDGLRKFLQELQKKTKFNLQWARLFYLYGEGQNPNSLLAQLDRAIDNGDAVFNMSGGEQLRDYLPIEQAASILADTIENREFTGLMNCCSQHPISVRKLVVRHLASKNAAIKLNLGHYPYPEYEPLAFWGVK